MSINYETRLFINNEFVPGKAGRRFAISNPANDEVICDIHEALEEDVNLAIDAAQAAFEDWSSCNAGERAAFLTKFAHLIARDAEELAQLDAVALGKPVELLKKLDIRTCVGVYIGSSEAKPVL